MQAGTISNGRRTIERVEFADLHAVVYTCFFALVGNGVELFGKGLEFEIGYYELCHLLVFSICNRLKAVHSPTISSASAQPDAKNDAYQTTNPNKNVGTMTSNFAQ